jgi:sorting nexin-29
VDNIPAETLQVDPHLSVEMLYPIFLNMWKEERFYKDWKEGIIMKILKKGDYRNCNNWRGIT